VDTEAFSPGGTLGLFPDVAPANAEMPEVPVLRRTWFHPGSWRHAQAHRKQLEKERYALDESAALLPDAVLPKELTTDEWQDAFRALRGEMVREEVFALDGSEDEPHPFLITQRSLSVRREQPQKGKHRAVLFVTERESLALRYERHRDIDGRLDPSVTHTLTLLVTSTAPSGGARPWRTLGVGRRRMKSTRRSGSSLSRS
jgi:hypothetical protein